VKREESKARQKHSSEDAYSVHYSSSNVIQTLMRIQPGPYQRKNMHPRAAVSAAVLHGLGLDLRSDDAFARHDLMLRTSPPAPHRLTPQPPPPPSSPQLNPLHYVLHMPGQPISRAYRLHCTARSARPAGQANYVELTA